MSAKYPQRTRNTWSRNSQSHRMLCGKAVRQGPTNHRQSPNNTHQPLRCSYFLCEHLRGLGRYQGFDGPHPRSWNHPPALKLSLFDRGNLPCTTVLFLPLFSLPSRSVWEAVSITIRLSMRSHCLHPPIIRLSKVWMLLAGVGVGRSNSALRKP